MAMVEMTVAEALTTRKNLKKKIEKKVKELQSVAVVSKSNPTVNGKSIEEWTATVKSKYQSLQHLSLNYDILNAAIIQSNCKTEVVMYGRKMAIAELVAMKTSPMNSVSILIGRELHKQMKTAEEKLKTESVDSDWINKAVAFIRCKDKTTSEDDIRKQLADINSLEIIDPLKKEREKQDKYYEEYVNKVDSIIQKSNCETKIYVEYVD